MTDTTKSVTKDITRGLPYKFRCRWFGKYDEEFSGTSPTGIDKDESDLTTYNGLSYTKTKIYDNNAIRIGALTVSDNDCSGFSSSKYLKLETPFNPSTSTWEAEFKFRTGSTMSTSQVIFQSRKGTAYADRFGVTLAISNSNHFQFWASGDGTGNIFVSTGTYTVEANRTYWVRIAWTGTEYYLAYSLDGTTYYGDCEYTSSTPLYSSLAYTYVGCGAAAGGDYPFLGTIDLVHCYIYINDSLFWWGANPVCRKLDFSNTILPWKWGYQKKLKNSVYAVVAYGQDVTYYSNTLNGTVNGSLYINPDKTISNFSSSNYLTVGNHNFSTANSWEYVSKFKATTIGKYQFFFHRPVAFGLDNSNRMHVWQLPVDNVYSDFTFSANTWYWVKFEFTGTEYNGYYKTTADGEWTRIIHVSSTSKVSSTTTPTYIGLNPNNTSEYFYGYIDLKEAYISINGVEVWRGFAKNSLSGCVNGDEDSGGDYYCYAINGDERVELRKKTDSVIVAYNTTPRYLGEVSVYDSGGHVFPVIIE